MHARDREKRSGPQDVQSHGTGRTGIEELYEKVSFVQEQGIDDQPVGSAVDPVVFSDLKISVSSKTSELEVINYIESVLVQHLVESYAGKTGLKTSDFILNCMVEFNKKLSGLRYEYNSKLGRVRDIFSQGESRDMQQAAKRNGAEKDSKEKTTRHTNFM